jgi:tripartite-type tricarboxylate transporter receptor subunit TctC
MSAIHSRRAFAASLANVPAFLAFGRPAAAALAEEPWPSRPVTIIVPFPPGGPSDISGRIFVQPLQQAIGQSVVVENRPGATGEVGGRAVVRSAPDGHTLLHSSIGTWAINVALRPNPGFDPVRQLTPITQTVSTPSVLVVNPEAIPADDLSGLVDWLTRKGAAAAYPSSGAGSTDHMIMEMFKQRTGTGAVHVPYAGGAPAVTSLISGTVQLAFQNLGSVLPHVQAGRVRAILVTSEARSPLLPGVPTAVEAGLGDFVITSWQALGGPAGMAPALVQRVYERVSDALHTPEAERRLGEIGFQVVGSTPGEFAAFQGREIARWRRVVEAGGITAG